MADEFDDWVDDPIVVALTSPAGPGELDGEAEVLAAFRAAAPRRLRLVRRLGTGGAAVAVTLVVTGGVAAAAYSSSLPAPVQDAFHNVFAAIGVPASHHHHHHHVYVATGATSPAVATVSTSPTPGQTLATPAAGAPSRSAAAPVTGSAVASTAAATTQPSNSATAPGAIASTTPSPSSGATSPAPTTSTTPTPTPTKTPAPAPATVDATVSRATVSPDGQVVVRAKVTDADGNPVPHHRVHIFEKLPGGTWQVVAVTHTNGKGVVHATEGPLATNARFEVRAGGVASAVLPVVVKPQLSGSVTPDDSAKTDSITISAMGAEPGDTIKALRKVDGKWQEVASGALASDGTVTVTVDEPQQKAKRLLIVLAATPDHARATTSVVLNPPATTG